MKKTIAKIMAAAMLLSAIPATSLNAAAGVANNGAMWVSELTFGGTSILDKETVGNYANPIDSKFTRTVNSMGYVTSITTNATLAA